jgi:hypothetical protein
VGLEAAGEGVGPDDELGVVAGAADERDVALGHGAVGADQEAHVVEGVLELLDRGSERVAIGMGGGELDPELLTTRCTPRARQRGSGDVDHRLVAHRGRRYEQLRPIRR